MRTLIFLLSIPLFAMSDKKPVQPEPTEPMPNIISIESIVAKSSCSSYGWKNRGPAPRGFLLGVARVYRSQVCDGIKALPMGPPSKDALSFYGASGDALLNAYALLIGLGMRESSGQYCEGQDASAPGNRTGERAEAGLFQTSWDSRAHSKSLVEIFSKYKMASASKCDLSTFKLGVSASYCASPSRAKNYGSGDGLEFQKLSKHCPAFATEYAATMVRVGRSHYGPLNNKAAEIRTDCKEMLAKIAAQPCQ